MGAEAEVNTANPYPALDKGDAAVTALFLRYKREEFAAFIATVFECKAASARAAAVMIECELTMMGGR